MADHARQFIRAPDHDSVGSPFDQAVVGQTADRARDGLPRRADGMREIGVGHVQRQVDAVGKRLAELLGPFQEKPDQPDGRGLAEGQELRLALRQLVLLAERLRQNDAGLGIGADEPDERLARNDGQNGRLGRDRRALIRQPEHRLGQTEYFSRTREPEQENASLARRRDELDVSLAEREDAVTARAFLEEEQIFLARSRAFELAADRVQDIDTPEDWSRAESRDRGTCRDDT